MQAKLMMIDRENVTSYSQECQASPSAFNRHKKLKNSKLRFKIKPTDDAEEGEKVV